MDVIAWLHLSIDGRHSDRVIVSAKMFLDFCNSKMLSWCGLQIIQKFDFTKDIPKIVIVSAGQKTFEAPECILLTLFNLIGFDIIVFTPTGYKNLEAFIRPEAFQEFIHGEFKYDFRPQNLALPKEIPQEKTSLFERIFKGKK